MSLFNNSDYEQRLRELETKTEKILKTLATFPNLIDLLDQKVGKLKEGMEVLVEQDKILHDSVSQLGKAYSDLSKQTQENFATHRKVIEEILNDKSKLSGN